MKLKSYSDYRRIYRYYALYSVFICGLNSVKTFLHNPKKSSNEPLITFITFSIFPELTRIWYYFANSVAENLRKAGFTTKLLIVDCSGKLNSSNFAGAIIEKFINERHPHKLDFFSRDI